MSEVQEKVEKFKQSSVEVRYTGLLTLLSQYMENPTEDKKVSVKVYIVNVLSLDEFLDFFLDNLSTIGNLEGSIEAMKKMFEKGGSQ